MKAAPTTLPRTDSPQRTLHRTRPHALVEALAFFLPFSGTLSQIRGEALWRSDSAVLSALRDAPEFQGILATALGRLALCLPLGNFSFRLAIPAAFFCGLAGLSVLLLCHTLFARQGGYSRLDPWLALGASLSASFSLPWVAEGSVAGGATVGAGLSLCLLQSLIKGGLPRTLLSSVLVGCAMGALASESAWAAGLVFLAALCVWPETNALLQGPGDTKFRHALRLGALFGSALLTAAALILPALASHSITSLRSASSGGAETTWPLFSPLTWIGSIGFLWTAGALFALLFSLEDKRPLYALGLFVLLDWLLPGNGSLGWTDSPRVDESRVAVHLVALAVVAPLGALGLRTLGESAQALRLFAARPLAAMVAVLAIAGCLASAEDSLRSLGQAGTSGSQAWTDEALNALPDGALVLVKTDTWGRRLLSAQALGARPDVLVVPLSEVTQPSTLRLWLEKEPELETLLRDLSVSNSPSERALARLVDQREVFLEPDAGWDRRLLEHVLPALPLARFSSHAVGRSDRLAALDLVPEVRSRIVAGYQDGLTEERATKSILSDSFAQNRAVLDAVKDGQSSRALGELHPDYKPEKLDEEEAPLNPLAVL